MKELRTEIEIDAPVERVWESLVDFASFPEWNPFIREVHGRPEVGTRLEVTLGASGTKPMTFRPTVKAATANRELRWLGRVGIPGLFDGEHIFELAPVGPGRTRFVQRERFGGLFVPLLWKTLDRDARRGFEEMNQALRDRVSGRPAGPP